MNSRTKIRKYKRSIHVLRTFYLDFRIFVLDLRKLILDFQIFGLP